MFLKVADCIEVATRRSTSGFARGEIESRFVRKTSPLPDSSMARRWTYIAPNSVSFWDPCVQSEEVSTKSRSVTKLSALLDYRSSARDCGYCVAGHRYYSTSSKKENMRHSSDFKKCGIGKRYALGRSNPCDSWRSKAQLPVSP